ncbi:DUF4262 domain-containing protein [Alteromonas sp. ASW11-19]|uniref:DUF4262 domain-containing protein n=1 Tax=Alteromonas salexigens TaxID=2982530 RepID=A0ABT2VW77_9ALTE|nr:DUF4262 domain-containing protein [Alteromonas salexigens]MCU7556094.1 DUF4262 domain-containing protein [Alteromonas salexigens]
MSKQKIMDRIKVDIDKRGRSVITVMGGQTYSVGEALAGREDIILTTPLQPELCTTLINDACQGLRDGTISGQKTDKVIKGFDVWLLPCSDELTAEYISAGAEFYLTQTDTPIEVRYLQLVLPDSNGKYPWEQGYDTKFTQPLLCRPPAH